MIPLSDRARRRWTGRLFLFMGIVPLVVVALGAVWFRFGPTATVLSQRWSWKLGAEVSIDEVTQPRPGMTRLTGVTLRSRETGRKLAEIRRIEISGADGTMVSPVNGNGSANADRQVGKTVCTLELTAPTVDLTQRTELMRILEQSLITRCGERVMEFRWAAPTLTANCFTDTASGTVTIPAGTTATTGGTALRLTDVRGTYVAGKSGNTPSWMEIFFRLVEDGDEAKPFTHTTRQPAVLPVEVADCDFPESGSGDTMPEIRVRMQRSVDESTIWRNAGRTPVLRTTLELDTGIAEIPASVLAALGNGSVRIGDGARFCGRITARADGSEFRMDATRIARFDPSDWLRRASSEHWIEAVGTLDDFHITWSDGQFTRITGRFSAENGVVSGSLVREAGFSLNCSSGYKRAGWNVPDVAFARMAVAFDLSDKGLRLTAPVERQDMWFDDVDGNPLCVILVDRSEHPILSPCGPESPPITFAGFVRAMIPNPPDVKTAATGTTAEQAFQTTAYRDTGENLLHRREELLRLLPLRRFTGTVHEMIPAQVAGRTE